MAKVTVKRTDNNYGFAVSGKLGSQPALEEEYVRKFSTVDAKDGVVSLREAVQAAMKDKTVAPEEWHEVHRIQKDLEKVKDKLIKAGYTWADLMKLTLDNS